MDEDKVLKIIDKVYSNKQFSKLLEEGESKDIIKNLQKDGVEVDEKDIADSLKVKLIIENLRISKPVQDLKKSVRLTSENNFDLGLELQEKLIGVIEQIDKGYERVMMMYTVAFYLGVVLVLISVFASLALGSNISTLILGGLGIADVIASLIFKPAQALQNSRGNLAQLQAAFINWINDIHNWNRYWNNLIDEDVNTSKHLPAFDKVQEVSETLLHNTECMMKMIEKYCEMYSNQDQKRSKIRKEARSEKKVT